MPVVPPILDQPQHKTKNPYRETIGTASLTHSQGRGLARWFNLNPFSRDNGGGSGGTYLAIAFQFATHRSIRRRLQYRACTLHATLCTLDDGYSSESTSCISIVKAIITRAVSLVKFIGRWPGHRPLAKSSASSLHRAERRGEDVSLRTQRHGHGSTASPRQYSTGLFT